MAKAISPDEYVPITLDDMGVVPVTIKVTTPYGREMRLRLVPLTCAQWAEIGAQVPEPTEPPQKTPATQAVYEKYRREAEEERSYRRLVYALEAGGNPIEGATASEKAANWRKKVDQGITNSITRFLFVTAMGDQAEALDGDAAFQQDTGSHPADV